MCESFFWYFSGCSLADIHISCWDRILYGRFAGSLPVASSSRREIRARDAVYLVQQCSFGIRERRRHCLDFASRAVYFHPCVARLLKIVLWMDCSGPCISWLILARPRLSPRASAGNMSIPCRFMQSHCVKINLTLHVEASVRRGHLESCGQS